MSAIHYKFRSALEYKTLTFEGLHISVIDLKRLIYENEKINRSSDFDLQITNAQTKVCYEDEQSLVPRNTSVIIARIPASNPQKLPKVWDKSTEGAVQKQKPDAYRSYGASNTFDRQGDQSTKPEMSEEEKLKEMERLSTREYDPSTFIKRRSALKTGQAPMNYVCSRCNQSGHWLAQCPMANFRRTTGIPSDDLMETTPDDPQAMLTARGTYAVPIMHKAAKMIGKKEKAPFWDDDNAGAGSSGRGGDSNSPARTLSSFARPSAATSAMPAVPQELLCRLCDGLLRDAVLIKCCCLSFCDECVRSRLLESEQHECPFCNALYIDPDSLLPNSQLRQAVNTFRNESGGQFGRRAEPPSPPLITAPVPRSPSPKRQMQSQHQASVNAAGRYEAPRHIHQHTEYWPVTMTSQHSAQHNRQPEQSLLSNQYQAQQNVLVTNIMRNQQDQSGNLVHHQMQPKYLHQTGSALDAIKSASENFSMTSTSYASVTSTASSFPSQLPENIMVSSAPPLSNLPPGAPIVVSAGPSTSGIIAASSQPKILSDQQIFPTAAAHHLASLGSISGPVTSTTTLLRINALTQHQPPPPGVMASGVQFAAQSSNSAGGIPSSMIVQQQHRPLTEAEFYHEKERLLRCLKPADEWEEFLARKDRKKRRVTSSSSSSSSSSGSRSRSRHRERSSRRHRRRSPSSSHHRYSSRRRPSSRSRSPRRRRRRHRSSYSRSPVGPSSRSSRYHDSSSAAHRRTSSREKYRRRGFFAPSPGRTAQSSHHQSHAPLPQTDLSHLLTQQTPMVLVEPVAVTRQKSPVMVDTMNVQPTAPPGVDARQFVKAHHIYETAAVAPPPNKLPNHEAPLLSNIKSETAGDEAKLSSKRRDKVSNPTSESIAVEAKREPPKPADTVTASTVPETEEPDATDDKHDREKSPSTKRRHGKRSRRGSRRSDKSDDSKRRHRHRSSKRDDDKSESQSVSESTAHPEPMCEVKQEPTTLPAPVEAAPSEIAQQDIAVVKEQSIASSTIVMALDKATSRHISIERRETPPLLLDDQQQQRKVVRQALRRRSTTPPRLVVVRGMSPGDSTTIVVRPLDMNRRRAVELVVKEDDDDATEEEESSTATADKKTSSSKTSPLKNTIKTETSLQPELPEMKLKRDEKSTLQHEDSSSSNKRHHKNKKNKHKKHKKRRKEENSDSIKENPTKSDEEKSKKQKKHHKKDKKHRKKENAGNAQISSKVRRSRSTSVEKKRQK